MGKRGPQKTPTNILKMRGSPLAGQRAEEPQPERTKPVCPAWVNEQAKTNYKWLVPQLDKMGVLGKCDRNALARYCQLLARYRAAEEFVEQHGPVYIIRDDEGKLADVREYPQAKRALTLADKLLKLEREFGLTPSARAGMAKVQSDPNENRGKDKARFFKNG